MLKNILNRTLGGAKQIDPSPHEEMTEFNNYLVNRRRAGKSLDRKNTFFSSRHENGKRLVEWRVYILLGISALVIAILFA